MSALAVVAVVALGGWYFLFRDHAPPPVSLDSALQVAAASSTATAGGAATTANTAAGGSASAAANDSGTSELAGTWELVADGQSFVGYRVEEELASIGATTAVGRTTAVSGTLAFDGSEITEVTVEADVTQLTSDRSMRDNALRRQALETSKYGTATFALTEPIAIADDVASGAAVSANAIGDLTLHGVTRSVTIRIEGQLVDGKVVVVGSLDIAFADFDIEQPSAASVLSVEDHGTIEVQLIFQPA
ncbi:MAG: YceI family protein [Dehalococcoidia bacterium]